MDRDYSREGGEAGPLSYPHPVSRESFGNSVIPWGEVGSRDIQHAKPSPFVACVGGRTLITQRFYGVEHGNGRYEALGFFVDMRKTRPDIAPIEFLVDFRGRLNADYADSIYDGIRIALHFLDRTSTPTGLRERWLWHLLQKDDHFGATQSLAK